MSLFSFPFSFFITSEIFGQNWVRILNPFPPNPNQTLHIYFRTFRPSTSSLSTESEVRFHSFSHHTRFHPKKFTQQTTPVFHTLNFKLSSVVNACCLYTCSSKSDELHLSAVFKNGSYLLMMWLRLHKPQCSSCEYRGTRVHLCLSNASTISNAVVKRLWYPTRPSSLNIQH